ncbi:DUF228 domain-containing protein [Candidatus Borreliella tachyglossi]|uniref:DUF228 domain-containing protein n=1 Tax=Candidatus Borreliella tachyglossi TaxID=1964448 RepID=UPI004040F31F
MSAQQDTSALQKQIQQLQQEKSNLETQLQQEKAKTAEHSKQQDALSALQNKGSKDIRPTMATSEGFVDNNKTYGSNAFTKVDSQTRIEAIPYKTFCHKMGVKLVKDTDYEKQVEAGGGDDLYGVCINVDEFLRVAQVVRTVCQGHFVCKDNTIKAGDKLIFNPKGVLEKAEKSKNPYAHATAVKDSFKFKDKDAYGVEVDFHANLAPKVS